jgi:hypothetical protein
MFEDGAKGLNVEETFAVRDVAELVASQLEANAPRPGSDDPAS